MTSEMKQFPLWNKSSEWLPPEDGKYLVTNKTAIEATVFEYDGYGFHRNGYYMDQLLWRFLKPLTKRYGKVNAPESETNP